MLLGRLLNGSIKIDSSPLSPITGIVRRYDMNEVFDIRNNTGIPSLFLLAYHWM